MVYGKKTLLTAKPVQLPTTTGVFLIARPSCSVSSTTCMQWLPFTMFLVSMTYFTWRVHKRKNFFAAWHRRQSHSEPEQA